MSDSHWVLAVGFAVIQTVGATPGSRAAEPRPAGRSAGETLTELLSEQATGADVDRRSTLAAVLQARCSNPEVYWQSGFVRGDRKWLPFEAVTGRDRSAALEEYRRLRETTPRTVRGQVALANWCRRHGLDQRERAHLTFALERTAYSNGDLRRRLGRIHGDGTMTAREWEAQRDDARRFRANLVEWKSEVVGIRNRLASRRESDRVEAKRRLTAIDDPAAVPALHVYLGTSEDASVTLIETLARLESVDASRSLAWHGVFAPSAETRDRALGALAERDQREFVPAVLDLVRTPYRERHRIVVGRHGVFHEHYFASETLHQREVVARLNHERMHVLHHYHRFEKSPGGTAEHVIEPAPTPLGLRRAMARTLAERRIAAVRNREIESVNERVVTFLSRLTGRDLATCDDVWRYWHDFLELEPCTGSQKPICVEIQYDNRAHGFREDHLRVPCLSCLVAGTSIWTDEGPRPIESLKPGDVVLGQDARTGELAYRPVLRTTVRAPRPTFTIELRDGTTIRATGGHPFWISGEGWTLTRDVHAGQRLHTVTGTMEITSVLAEDDAPTYNLVVDDLHSYFVGNALVLSHDVTLHELDDRTVPGLDTAPRPADE